VDDESVDKIRAESIITKYLLAQMMVLSSPLTTAQLLKRFTPLLAAPVALLLNPGRADAVLTYNIFQSGPDVVMQTSGSLIRLPLTCCSDRPLEPGMRTVYSQLITGLTATTPYPIYPIGGPNLIPTASPLVLVSASSTSGISTVFASNDERGKNGYFGIETPYTYGTPINSSATFNNTTLAALGFTTTGLIGSWFITTYFENESTTDAVDTINVVVGPPATAAVAVPGPLPLLGVAATFGWSRRLRHRIANAKTPAAG
jgi:hypothetical protein